MAVLRGVRGGCGSMHYYTTGCRYYAYAAMTAGELYLMAMAHSLKWNADL
jgi:hypothetical protein